MVTSKGDTGEQLEINVNDIKLEQVNQYTYLGSLITEDGMYLREVKKRIAHVKEAFWKNRDLLRGNVNIDLKMRNLKWVFSVVTHAAET